MMKRYSSLILIFTVLALATLLLASCSNSGFDEASGFYYEKLDDGTYAVTNYAGEATEVTVPSHIKGGAVTEVRENTFAYSGKVVSVSIPDSVAEIGDYAFRACTALQSVELPSGLTKIGTGAFRGCTALQTVEIPGSIKEIPSYLFCDATSLTEVTVGDGIEKIGEYAFYECASLSKITVPSSVEAIGVEAFYGCSALSGVYIEDVGSWAGIIFADKSANPLAYANKLYYYNTPVDILVLPDGLSRVENYAFIGLGIKGISFGEGDIEIGDYAFADGGKIVKLTIPATVKSIGDGAFSRAGVSELVIEDGGFTAGADIFSGCNVIRATVPASLSTNPIILPKSTLEYVKITGTGAISDRLLYGAKNLTRVEISSGITAIGSGVFNSCQKLVEVSIPDTVVSIGSYAFSGCLMLSHIEIPRGLESIGDKALEGCPIETATVPTIVIPLISKGVLQSIVIDGGKVIPAHAFANCNNLKEVTVKEGVEVISERAFSHCEYLYYIDLPDSITTIGANAFLSCYVLPSVYLSENLTEIGDFAFRCCNTFSIINIPKNVTKIGIGAFANCPSLAYIMIDAANTAYKSVDGNIFSKDGTVFVQYVNGRQGRDFKLPANVTRINSYAFANSTIRSISLPTTLVEIGAFAFYECIALSSVVLPDGVERICSSAFYRCKGLKSINIPDSVRIIEHEAFYFCESLESVVIKPTVTTIEYNAFQMCEVITIYCTCAEDEKPEGWADTWSAGCNVEWGYTPPEPEA